MFAATIEKIKRLLTPESAHRYTVRLLNTGNGARIPSRVGAEEHGGVWSDKHCCFLFTQHAAEWYCYVRNHSDGSPWGSELRIMPHVQAYTERVI